MSRRNLQTGFVFVVAIALGMIGTQLLPTSVSVAQQAARTKWEYSTHTVKSEELGEHLAKCSTSGFEVFSIERANSRLVQPSENVNEIRTTEYQVTARRER